jgi:hypothetical protein
MMSERTIMTGKPQFDSLYPFVQVGKIRRQLNEYNLNKLNENENTIKDNNYGYIAGPIRKHKLEKAENVPEPELTSGKLIDSNLNILSATHDQKELLKKAGLTIDDDADVRVIKDKDGNLKSAISIKRDEKTKEISKVNYIDTDQNDKYFKQAIAKIATIPGGVSLQKQGVTILKEEINPKAIVND